MAKQSRTRSQVADLSQIINTLEEPRLKKYTPGRLVIQASMLKASDSKKRQLILEKFLKEYKISPRSLQVESVLHLVNGRNTFLLAGTGYGKTRIAELYYHLFPKRSHPIVLVINPLDALGDNQVSGCANLFTTYRPLTDEQTGKIGRLPCR